MRQGPASSCETGPCPMCPSRSEREGVAPTSPVGMGSAAIYDALPVDCSFERRAHRSTLPASSEASHCLAGSAVTVALQMTRCSASPPAAIGMLSRVPTIKARAPLGCSTSIRRPWPRTMR
jgi:hypothetical protein